MSSPPRFRRIIPAPLSDASDNYYVNTLAYTNSPIPAAVAGANEDINDAAGPTFLPRSAASTAATPLQLSQSSPMNNLISRIFDSASSSKAKAKQRLQYQGSSPSPFSRANRIIENSSNNTLQTEFFTNNQNEADSSQATQINTQQSLTSLNQKNPQTLKYQNNLYQQPQLQQRQLSKPRTVKFMQPHSFSLQPQENLPKSSKTQADIAVSPTQSSTNLLMLPRINSNSHNIRSDDASSKSTANYVQTEFQSPVKSNAGGESGQQKVSLHKSSSSKDIFNRSSNKSMLLMQSPSQARQQSIERLKSEMSIQKGNTRTQGSAGSFITLPTQQSINGIIITKESTPTTKKLFHQVVSPSFFQIQREAPKNVYEKIAPIASLYNNARLMMDASREVQEVTPIYPRYYHKGRKHDVDVFCGKIAAYTVINSMVSDKRFHIREYTKEQKRQALRNFERESPNTSNIRL